MPDPIIMERLELIQEHASTILQRMTGIKEAPDFIQTETGKIIYDSLLIRLQGIGENIKKIEKLNPGFVETAIGVDINKIIRFRDLVSHHYELLDYQVIYNICTLNIPELHTKISEYLNEIQ